jgi:mRNA interferase RelE/StbE
MAYSVGVERKAQKQIARLPATTQDRIEDALQALANDPRPRSSRRLRGREGLRLRVGDYRVIYEIDDDRQIVTILQVGHRRDVYRRG